MKIDVTIGVISFAETAIGPHLSRQEFLRTPLASAAKVGVVNDGWVTLHVQPEPDISASLSFKDDRLVNVVVSMKMPSGEAASWDRAHELRRRTYHDAWLKSKLGDPPYEYMWGGISSLFTEQDCSSDIVITFGKIPFERAWWEKKGAPK